MRPLIRFTTRLFLTLTFCTPALADIDVGKIKSGDVNSLENRLQSKNFWSFEFGPAWPQDLQSDQLMYLFSFGHHWEVSRHGEIRTSLTGATSEDGQTTFGSAMLGGTMMPLTGVISPVLGVELGFAHADGKKSADGSGFAGSVLAGARIFRMANAQIEVLGRYSLVFDNNTPGILGIQFGMLW